MVIFPGAAFAAAMRSAKLFQLRSARTTSTSVPGVRAAKSKVLAIHASHCIEDAVQGGDPAVQREKFTELIDLFGKVGR